MSLTIPVLAGPTASGKSALALELTRHSSVAVEIISADAMMVYRGMDIGTAKPSAQERHEVPHHLLDLRNPDAPFSVADYVPLAENAIAEVLGRKHIPLLVGGTGFYIRALSQGLPTVPEADPEVQETLWQRYQAEGLAPLKRELKAHSPEDAERAADNPRRVVRALEILQRTGRAPKDFPYTQPRFRYCKLVLNPPLETLKPRITARTDAMFAAGLVDEVKALLERYPEQPTALQAIGYKEVAAHLRGETTLAEAKDTVQQATVRYAKRQRTWFRKEPGAQRLEPVGEDALEAALSWLEPTLS